MSSRRRVLRQVPGLDRTAIAEHEAEADPHGQYALESGLGTLSAVNDAPSDGSTYGRNNGAWAVAGGGVTDGDKGDITVSGGGLTWTLDIVSAYGRTVIDDADASAARVTLGLGNVQDVALSTWAGTANITTLGTVTTGTWSATAIGATKGGTAQTTWATGDLLVATAADTLGKLAAGTSTHVLTSNGAGVAPSWQAVPGGGGGLSQAQVLARQSFGGF